MRHVKKSCFNIAVWNTFFSIYDIRIKTKNSMVLTTLECEALASLKHACHDFSNEGVTLSKEQNLIEVSKSVLPILMCKRYIDGGGYMYDEEEAVQASVRIVEKLLAEVKKSVK